MSIQKEIKSKLESVGLPFLEIECYGSQLTIECKSFSACEKWSLIIGKFAKVKGIIKSISYKKENKNTSLIPSTRNVFRLYSKIGD
jgi:hypothetical protein